MSTSTPAGTNQPATNQRESTLDDSRSLVQQGNPHAALFHTGMCVPHRLLSIGSMSSTATDNGVAVVADILLDGHPVGMIVNDGNGGGTELFSPNNLFGGERMRDYAEACRLRGSALSQEAVLDLLLDEHQQAELVSLVSAGQTVIRQLDGDLSHVFIIDYWIGPVAADLPRKVSDYLQRETRDPGGGQWQWWDGQRWQPLRVNGASRSA